MLKTILEKLKVLDLIKYLRNNSLLFEKYYSVFLLKKHAKNKSVLVYTMGKVGSATVENSLANQLDDYSVYHLHWLDKDNLKTSDKFNAKFYRRNEKLGITTKLLPSYLSNGFFISSKISNNRLEKDRYKIFTLTRDPVGRNISSFFQGIDRVFGYDIERKMTEKDEDVIVNELMDIFLNEFIGKNGVNYFDCDPLSWFDNELKSVFDFDIYSYEFPIEKGYDIYENDNVSILLVRLEDLGECFEEATEEFLGKEIKMNSSKNVGNKRDYSSIYKKFKNTIPIPTWYLDKMYNSKYARHFYSDTEIKSFRDRWEKDPVQIEEYN